MKVLTKLFFCLFVFSLVLTSCTVEELTDSSVDSISTNPPKQDIDPPIDEPND